MSRQLSDIAVAAGSGLLFGAGLYVAQMVDPLKVLHFLDFGAISSGGWDPSLAVVLAVALLVMFVAVSFGRARGRPFFDGRFHEPTYRKVDARLVGGSALFGLGWGMTGLCPGPAIALIAFAPDGLWLFLAAMFVGALLGCPLMRAPAAAARATP